MSGPELPKTPGADPDPVGELNHELLRGHRLLSMVRGELATMLPAGLDPAAAMLLIVLVKQGPARQGDLAGHTFLDPSTISRRAGQLVEHGLAARRPDPTDGRAVRLEATGAGAELVGRMRSGRDRLTREVLADWAGTDVEQLAGLLRRFNDALDSYHLDSHQPPRGER